VLCFWTDSLPGIGLKKCVSRPHSCVRSPRKLTPSSSIENKSGNPRTPLNALISGPLVGGNWDAGDPAPRSVTLDWWHKVCPESDIQTIFSDELKDPVRDRAGDVIFRRMVDVIRDAPGRCVEVVSSPTDSYPQLYDLWMIGNERSVPLSELFINTSTSRLLGASPIVDSAIRRNEYLLLPQGPRVVQAPIDPYARMMAVHIRR
jgi:hypothetical protein